MESLRLTLTLYLLLILSASMINCQVCWADRALPQQFHEMELSFTNKYLFSLESTSGKITGTQETPKKQIFGDFGIVRVHEISSDYAESVSVYQASSLRVTEPVNIPLPWLELPHANKDLLEIQILHSKSFGSEKSFENVGMSFFITVQDERLFNLPQANISTIEQKLQASKFSEQLSNPILKNSFKLQNYFPLPNPKHANNVYIYRVKNFQNYYENEKGNQEECGSMIWLVRRNIIQVSRQEFKSLKEAWGVDLESQISEQDSEGNKKSNFYAASIKVFQDSIVENVGEINHDIDEKSSCGESPEEL